MTRECTLRISEAAGLAIHAVTAIAQRTVDTPMKIVELAELLRASESHLGKVMHRLALAKIVISRRGPNGGFVLGPKASEMTLLDLYEMFNGPISEENCLLGYSSCPFGSCVLGDAITRTNEHLKAILGSRKLVEDNRAR